MATAQNPLKIIGSASATGAGSQELVLKESSNEFFFAVVGHAGSGTSVVAEQLRDLLQQRSIGLDHIDVDILKARTAIEAWATAKGFPLSSAGGPKTLKDVERLQDYGDEMRGELRKGRPDCTAVAWRLIFKIREMR